MSIDNIRGKPPKYCIVCGRRDVQTRWTLEGDDPTCLFHYVAACYTCAVKTTFERRERLKRTDPDYIHPEWN